MGMRQKNGNAIIQKSRSASSWMYPTFLYHPMCRDHLLMELQQRLLRLRPFDFALVA